MSYISHNKNANKGTIHDYSLLVNVLQQVILENDIKIIVEIGCAAGQLTFPLAEVLYNKNNDSILYAYDWWDNSNDGFHIFSQKDFEQNLLSQPAELQNIIKFKRLNYFDWLKSPDPYNWDMLYLDVNNDGDKIKQLYELYRDDIDNKRRFVFFEGGSDGRFQKEIYKNKTKFSEIHIPFTIINNNGKELSLLGNYFKI